MNTNKFQEVCPSLIQQIESGVCNEKTLKEKIPLPERKTTWERKYLCKYYWSVNIYSGLYITQCVILIPIPLL